MLTKLLHYPEAYSDQEGKGGKKKGELVKKLIQYYIFQFLMLYAFTYTW